MPRNKQKGFSLIEVMMVVAIGLILVGLAVPLIQSAMRNYTLNSAASNVTRIAQLARNAAIRKGGDACTVLVGDAFGVDGITDACDGALSNTEPRYIIPGGVSLDSTGPGVTTGMNFTVTPDAPSDFVITFNARGASTTAPTPQVIFLGGWGEYTGVTISAAGRARTWRYYGSTWH